MKTNMNIMSALVLTALMSLSLKSDLAFATEVETINPLKTDLINQGMIAKNKVANLNLSKKSSKSSKITLEVELQNTKLFLLCPDTAEIANSEYMICYADGDMGNVQIAVSKDYTKLFLDGEVGLYLKSETGAENFLRYEFNSSNESGIFDIEKRVVIKDKCANEIVVKISNDVSIEFCEIPAAKGVIIGSTNGDDDEKPGSPRHFESFHMAKYEITQLQYKTITETTPWSRDGLVKNDFPAVNMNHSEAVSFTRILNELDKTAHYRLPTEDEFEYATRAGTDTNYYWGNNIDSTMVFYDQNSNYSLKKVYTCPSKVRQELQRDYCANAFGLYHMLGNASEWVLDAYFSYGDKADGNSFYTSKKSNPKMVVRGGHFASNEHNIRSSYRNTSYANDRNENIGFRIVREPKN